MGLTIQLHAVTGLELAAALGLLKAIHAYFSPLDALLGLTTCEHQTLPFQELIQADRLGAGRRRSHGEPLQGSAFSLSKGLGRP